MDEIYLVDLEKDMLKQERERERFPNVDSL